MKTNDYRQLKIWQKSMQVAEDIYLKIVMTLPREERFGLADQMRRSSISIPSNIAEGHARNSNKEFIHFLSISRGSIAELQTQLLFCNRVRYIHDDLTNDLFVRLKEIDKMTFSLMQKLENKG